MCSDNLLKILAFVTLFEMMIYVGLSASVSDFIDSAKSLGLVARGVLSNYVLVPAITVGLLLLFHPHPLVAVGFLILAVCPAGPYGTLCTQIAKGNVGQAAGLMVLLSGFSPLLSPLLLRLLVPIASGDRMVKIPVAKMVLTLLVAQLLPVLGGFVIQKWRPQLAAKLVGPAETGTKILNALFFAALLYPQFHLLLLIKFRGFVGMAILLMATMAIGWAFGGPGREARAAMTLTTAVRNNGGGMVIATGAFSGTAAVTAAVVYGVVGFLGALLLALWWGRLALARAVGESVP
jgi:BASS family bile acid:Na+ symporter